MKDAAGLREHGRVMYSVGLVYKVKLETTIVDVRLYVGHLECVFYRKTTSFGAGDPHT